MTSVTQWQLNELGMLRHSVYVYPEFLNTAMRSARTMFSQTAVSRAIHFFNVLLEHSASVETQQNRKRMSHARPISEEHRAR